MMELQEQNFFVKSIIINFIPVFMTNYHIIKKEFLKRNNEIVITLNDDKIEKKIKLNDNRKIYLNE